MQRRSGPLEVAGRGEREAFWVNYSPNPMAPIFMHPLHMLIPFDLEGRATKIGKVTHPWAWRVFTRRLLPMRRCPRDPNFGNPLHVSTQNDRLTNLTYMTGHIFDVVSTATPFFELE